MGGCTPTFLGEKSLKMEVEICPPGKISETSDFLEKSMEMI
jgi:hypothetical protein